MRGGDFGLVDGHNGGEHTNTETGNDTAKHHHGHRVGEGLESATNEKNARAIEDGLSSPDDISDAADNQGRDEGTNLEDSNHSTYIGFGRMAKVVHEVWAARAMGQQQWLL